MAAGVRSTPDAHARPPRPALDVPRPPWRGLALLTAAVVLAHLALLGLAPMAVGPHPSPLASKFITRTIVIAPPAAEPPPAPPAARPRAKPPPPKPARPRPRAPARRRPRPPPETPRRRPRRPRPRSDGRRRRAEAGAPRERRAGGAAAAGTRRRAHRAGGRRQRRRAARPRRPCRMRIPGSVRLAFAATGQQGTSPMQGVFGDLVWLQDGQQYDAQLSLTFLFRTIRSQHSSGVIGASGIEPARFSDTRRNEVASHFMRDAGHGGVQQQRAQRAAAARRAGPPERDDAARRPAGRRSRRAIRPVRPIAIQTVGPRDADIWIFKVEGDETLSLPAGEFAARKLTRNPRKPFDDKVELWLAPELGYLPVRIKQTQSNGDFADLQLRERGTDAPLKPKEAQKFTACAYKTTAHLETGALIAI